MENFLDQYRHIVYLLKQLERKFKLFKHKILNFWGGKFFTVWSRIRIPNPDPMTLLNPDPMRI
jgi:hypothetical protein